MACLFSPTWRFDNAYLPRRYKERLSTSLNGLYSQKEWLIPASFGSGDVSVRACLNSLVPCCLQRFLFIKVVRLPFQNCRLLFSCRSHGRLEPLYQRQGAKRASPLALPSVWGSGELWPTNVSQTYLFYLRHSHREFWKTKLPVRKIKQLEWQ